MKKRIISMVMLLTLALGLATNCFASSVEPYSNRYYFVYEEDKELSNIKTFTITVAQAKSKETFKAALVSGFTAYFTKGLSTIEDISGKAKSIATVVIEEMLRRGIDFASGNDPYKDFGDYTVGYRNGYRYEVDRLTGNRRVVEKYLIIHCDIYQWDTKKEFSVENKLNLK